MKKRWKNKHSLFIHDSTNNAFCAVLVGKCVYIWRKSQFLVSNPNLRVFPYFGRFSDVFLYFCRHPKIPVDMSGKFFVDINVDKALEMSTTHPCSYPLCIFNIHAPSSNYIRQLASQTTTLHYLPVAKTWQDKNLHKTHWNYKLGKLQLRKTEKFSGFREYIKINSNNKQYGIFHFFM